MSHLRSWGREFCHTFKRYGSKKKKKEVFMAWLPHE